MYNHFVIVYHFAS